MSAVRLLIADRFRDEVDALCLPEPGALERWRATGRPVEGGRGGSVRVELPESRVPIHLRPLRHGGWLRGLTGRRFLGTARGDTEFAVTAKLRETEAPVPEAVLALARRRGPFWQIDVGTCFLEPSISLGKLFSDSRASDTVAAAGAAGEAVRRFHDAGGSHADLHSGNLLVCQDEVAVVDLDRARVLATVPPERRCRELMRFERSLRKRHARHPKLEEIRQSFLESYTAGDTKLGRALAAHARRERLRNAVHALIWR